MSLSPAFLDELRHRTSLSGLIGKTTKLQRAGKEFRACCPFHNEKSPSFYVNDDKGFYHCFGCGAHGDAIRWLTENRGLPFMDAVKELAQTAGLEMPAQDRASAAKAERAKGLHEAMADAATWFADQLQGIAGAEARAVLAKRGIDAETARSFGLGYAPDSRGKLKDALKSYGDPMLVEAGLLIAVDGKAPYDRFRGRLIIPIRDPRGRPIAFGGRIIGEGEPKYLNSPETPLFDKGRTLYNLDRALPAARKTGRVIAVEGYMDVIALAQAGFDEVVAPLGTALTEHQIDRLWRVSGTPLLCFDGDAAGQRAAFRAAMRLLPMIAPRKSARFVMLTNGQDPDDIVREGGRAAFDEHLSSARDLHDFIWNYELAQLGSTPTPDDTASLFDRLQEHANKIVHKILREQYLQAFRDRFYALFGPAARRFTVVGKAIEKAVRDMRASLDYKFRRAVLLGLMMHTSMLREEWELVDQLPLANHKALRDWRDRILEVASYRSDLDENSLSEALEHAQLPEIRKRDIQYDLAFTFFHRDWVPDEARRDLKKVMELLIEESEVARATAAAEAACKADFNDATVTRLQLVKGEAQRIHARLMDWQDRLSEAA
ncbi:DNA primase [Sphingomonas sp. RS2018]